ALERDRNNGANVAYSAYALAALGEGERARERMTRAVLIDPDNYGMLYNFAAALSVFLHDGDGAVTMLESSLKTISPGSLDYLKIDPDFEPIRNDPRFVALIADADARHAAEAA